MKNFKRTYFFILNPVSGIKKDRLIIEKKIRDLFSDQDNLDYELRYTEYAGHACELAAQAVKQNADIVVAVGGDGTLNETASALVNTEISLGIVPRGSGNGFARSMNIPMEIDSALNVLINPGYDKVDVGVIDGCYFFNVAGIGIDAEISAGFQKLQRRGPLPYFYLGMKYYFNYQCETFELISEEGTRVVKPFLITFANTRQYGAGAIIAPGADFRDGLMEVCIVKKFPFHHTLKNVKMLFKGTLDRSPIYQSFRVKQLTVKRTGAKGIYHTDGEPKEGGSVLDIKMLQKAIRVCVPNLNETAAE